MANNNEKTIVIIGTTGQQGGTAFRHLHELGYKLRALVRDRSSAKAQQLQQAGAELVSGNLDLPDSLLRAFDGAYGVYSVQPTAEDSHVEIKQGVAVIEAAKRQGISRFVYSSVGSADESTGIAHFESKGKIEKHLRSSGLNYSIFRPVFLMENGKQSSEHPFGKAQFPSRSARQPSFR